MEEQKCKCPPPGLPAWLGTFADLMSLLMCFFVLLLSFSEMDVLKFKQIAGSMKFAFGYKTALRSKTFLKAPASLRKNFVPVALSRPRLTSSCSKPWTSLSKRWNSMKVMPIAPGDAA